ncbi:MAG: hypothetical protein KAW90_04070 [Dehalococcoidales bacterium]|nr:hypothetical protein [Dehalococcoidales bacterium]
MGIFNRNQPNDVLFLQPVRLTSEKTPRSKVRMLYCDTSGKVYSSMVSRSVYERARDNAASMAHRRKSFATIGLETGPGQFVPATVEVGQKEVWALEHILEHALNNGRLPDILKKYLKSIIRLNESERETIILEYRKRRRQPYPEVTPKVLERLPYYQEHDMEISMPIYKAEYGYPLIVLKRLPPEERVLHNTRRLLILDSDGDMAVIKVPTRLVRKIEIELTEHGGKKRGNTCVLISQYPEGYAPSYMSISHQQKKALDTLTRYFEETGSSKQPVSIAVKTVLTRAKDRVSSPAG